MESALLDTFAKLFDQWPTVAILLFIGYRVQQTLNQCLQQHIKHIEWLQKQLEKHTADDQSVKLVKR